MGTPFKFESDDGIGYFIIDTPPANRMGRAFFAQFLQFRNSILLDLDIKGMIVCGAGRHFSSGAILEEITELSRISSDKAQIRLEENSRCFSALEALPYPIVAAVNGCCLGSGMELALACHYRIASEKAVFSLPETGYGLIPGCGGTVRLPELIGTSKALHLILTGRSVLADDAFNLGLVDLVCSRDNLMKTARELIWKVNEERNA